MSPIVCRILSQTLLKRNLIDVDFVANFLDQNKLEEENELNGKIYSCQKNPFHFSHQRKSL
jgi:hypothetical protein